MTYGNPQLTPLSVQDSYVVVDVSEIIETLNQFVDSMYPEPFIDELLRQLIDYCNADFGIYMAHVATIVPNLGMRQTWTEEQQGPLAEAMHDSAMRFFMQIKELQLFGNGPNLSGFHFCLETRNGDAVILKQFSS